MNDLRNPSSTDPSQSPLTGKDPAFIQPALKTAYGEDKQLSRWWLLTVLRWLLIVAAIFFSAWFVHVVF